MMLTYEFLRTTIPFGWADLLWGYGRQLIGWRVPVDFAADVVATTTEPDTVVTELAALSKDEDWRVRPLLERLAAREPGLESTSARKWLYVTLFYIYSNSEIVDDVLAKVSDVYAEFGYPDEIRSFVPYMPPDDGYDPRVHSVVENKIRLMSKWRDYLDRARDDLLSGS